MSGGAGPDGRRREAIMSAMEVLMVKRTKAETEKFYREILAEQQRSGLSLRAFAAERSIPAGTLSCWRHQLKKRDAARARRKSASSRFVPVSVVADAPVTA